MAVGFPQGWSCCIWRMLLPHDFIGSLESSRLTPKEKQTKKLSALLLASAQAGTVSWQEDSTF